MKTISNAKGLLIAVGAIVFGVFGCCGILGGVTGIQDKNKRSEPRFVQTPATSASTPKFLYSSPTSPAPMPKKTTQFLSNVNSASVNTNTMDAAVKKQKRASVIEDEINNSGASAKCGDGTLSYSAHRRGTCSHHGGVAVWY